MTSGPSSTTPFVVGELRKAGCDDAQIAAITLDAGLRITFTTVDDAVGARPDAELREKAPPVVLDAVTWGCPISE